MAIDDNKLYNLKGSQLKDLSDKVKAKADQANTYTKAEVDNLIPDVSVLATKGEVSDGLALKADKSTTYTKTEVDGLIPDVSGFATKTELSEGLAEKADADTTYTKTEVDTALATKADTSTTYTKTEVDAALSAKADKATTYTKAEVDGLIPDVSGLATKTELNTGLDEKADKATTYTKTEVDTALGAKQDTLIAGTGVSIASDGKTISATSNVELNVDTTNDFATIQNQNQGISFDLSDANGVTMVASDPGTYYNSKTLATKPYTDSIAGNLANLTTTEKTNLVGAVNEVNGKTGMNLEVGKERWYGTYTDENGVTYQVYSKVVYIPALPATAGITKYDHGVSNIKQILSIYGFTTDGFVLNAPRQTVSDNITIYQASKSATNQTFSIEVGKDRSSKQAYVTMIYAKNN